MNDDGFFIPCFIKKSSFQFQVQSLIAYLVTWNDILTEIAATNGVSVFRFNTYIISVLVIFFLQVKHGFPTINSLSSAPTSIHFERTTISQIVREFFEFYGKSFEVSKKIISIHVGRWQDLEAPKQKRLSPEQRW